jgi:HD-GYP domain-containing protein (c-di-GMP phosphodiesterase class II)
MDGGELEIKVQRLQRLQRVGLALASEKNRDRLVERILIEAKELCNADGGTIYLRSDENDLKFAIMLNDTLGIHRTGKAIGLPAVPMFDPVTNEPNQKNVASYCALLKETVNIADAYDTDGFDFSGTKKFDAKSGYRSTSFLTIPMRNQQDRVIGVLQLINAKDSNKTVVPFNRELQELAEALASQAAVALDNTMLLAGQRALMEAFIKLIAAAIDDKSPYTGGHCRRVPVLTEMIAREVCNTKDGPLADFDLDEEGWYELHIAGWLHDCGKVITPVHIMDKATKLECIVDRMETIKVRFACAIQAASSPQEVAALREDLAFLEVANVGGEFMSDDKKERVKKIAQQHTWVDHRGDSHPILTGNEIYNLCISRGTLTDEERIVINGHMVATIRMLEALPFPRGLKRVPEYAGGHHEKMDGTGYPKGLFAGDMSIPARIMAIADVFEALTAGDRPYKKGKTLSESMKIMGFMKRDNHLDPDLFDVFVKSGVYKRYAQMYLPPGQIDQVDEAALLAIQPKAFTLPPEDQRHKRWEGFLPQYADTIREDDPLTSVSPQRRRPDSRVRLR